MLELEENFKTYDRFRFHYPAHNPILYNNTKKGTTKDQLFSR